MEQRRPLLYQQFLLGPEFVDYLPNWTVTDIGKSLKLATHPDLNITHVSLAQRSLTLVGSIFDPAASEATDVKILNFLLSRFSDVTALIEATSGYGGRWVMIAVQDEQRVLFHDALGLRQVFYTDVKRMDELWAMSQPGIIVDRFSLKISPDAQEYIDSREFQSNPQYRWPCAGTPFSEIKQLLPNHFLDLVSGKSYRYWPVAVIKEIPVSEALETLSKMFRGLVTAFATRFDVVLGITSGLDSRLVLAACKDFSRMLGGISIQQNTMNSSHPDLRVPARLLERLGLEHKVIKAKSHMTPKFAKSFRQSVFMAHDHYGGDAEAILKHFSHQKTVITGSGAEVGKCRYKEEFRNARLADITAETLLGPVNMGKNEFPIKHFTDWLNNLGNLYNIKVADLFQWEHAHGNWLALSQLEFNQAWREIFTPFNCRNVLTTMLAVPEQYRRPPHCELFLKLIENLWPELLCEPINPAYKATLLDRVRKRIEPLISKYLQPN